MDLHTLPEDLPPVSSAAAAPQGEAADRRGAVETSTDVEAAPELDDSPEALEALLAMEEEREAHGQVEAAAIPSVAWAPDHEQPDYAHTLVAEALGVIPPARFAFDLSVVKLLVEANHFQPDGAGGTIVFGLRGATLATGDRAIDVDSVTIEDARPDHLHFRCIIGFVNLQSGKISAFTASTVPNRQFMTNYYRIVNRLPPHGSTHCNILPTGCYIFRVGTHRGRVFPALRMTDPDNLTADAVCTVLRTANDLTYSHDDEWDRSTPFDNIHCAFFDDKFSSAGCNTIKGRDGEGPWGEFQAVLRRHSTNTRFDYLLLTGREAAIARAIIDAGRTGDAGLVSHCLERLRVGSRGEAVTALQKKLGFNGTAYFGPSTKKSLTERQAAADLASDGVHSPAADAILGWGVFGTVPPPQGIAGGVATGGGGASSGRQREDNDAEDEEEGGQEPGAAAPAEVVAVTAANFRALAPNAPAAVHDMMVASADAVLARYGINANARRLAHFMAQLAHESGGFGIRRESLNYTTAARIREVWPSRFPTVASAEPFVSNEEALAQKVYGDRLGNRDPGDGFRYRGRGFIQITGRGAYAEMGRRLGLALEDDPDLAIVPENALLIAAETWKSKKLMGERSMNVLADEDKIEPITYRINGGYTNLEDRIDQLEKARGVFGATEARRPSRVVERGDRGEAVEELQRALIEAGFLTGTVDGKFGFNTYRALVAFKTSAGLRNVGVAGKRTVRKLRNAGNHGRGGAVESLPRIEPEEPIRGAVALAEDVPSV